MTRMINLASAVKQFRDHNDEIVNALAEMTPTDHDLLTVDLAFYRAEIRKYSFGPVLDRAINLKLTDTSIIVRFCGKQRTIKL